MAEDGDRPTEDGLDSGDANPDDGGFPPIVEEHTQTIEVRASDPSHRLASGTRIGRYIVIGGIAPVGLGEAYAAFDPELDCKVILKLIGAEGADDNTTSASDLLASVAECTNLDHPSIAKIHAVGSYGDGVYVAMEFVEGIHLRQWMEARDEPFPWTEVLRVFRSAGRGLAAAHRQGIVHADFKPDNVFIEQHGRTCVLDFGLTRPDPHPRTNTPLPLAEFKRGLEGVVATDEFPEVATPRPGTPPYQAPEQLVGAEGDARTDQFAFCVAFYEVLYGERPFLHEEPRELLAEQLAHSIRSAPARDEVPDWLRRVLVRGLSPRRADRWPSMEALLGALDRDPSARRKRWGIGSALVAAALVAAAGIGWLSNRESRQCKPDETLLAGVWDASVRTALQDRFARSDRPYANHTWHTVESRLHEWTNEWLQLRELACSVTHVWGEANEELLERRYACLDARLGEIDAFGALYADATPAMLEHAGAAVFKIQMPRSCIAAATLDTHALAPESVRERVATLRQQQARGWVALHGGNADLAHELTRAVHQETTDLDVPALRVDNLLLQAQLEQKTNPAAALATLHEASGLAASHDLQQLAAQAWLALATLEPDAERARLALQYASFAVDRAQDARLEAALVERRGDLAATSGQLSAALTHYREALAALDKASDANPFAKARLLQKQGELLAQRSDLSAAERYFQRALELTTKLQGSEHPDLAPLLGGLGQISAARGQHEEAYVMLERALDLLESRADPDPVTTGSVERTMAAIELERGRASNAKTRIDRALGLLRGASVSAPLLVDALKTSAKIDLALRRPASAQNTLEEALALETEGELHELMARALWDRGDVRLRRRALEAAESARNAYARSASDADFDRVDGWLEERSSNEARATP